MSGVWGLDDIKDYTAIGDVVNQAARLQAQAGSSEILVSQDVYREVASAYPGVPSRDAGPSRAFPKRAVSYRLNGKPRSVLSAASWMPEDRPAMNWVVCTLAPYSAAAAWVAILPPHCCLPLAAARRVRFMPSQTGWTTVPPAYRSSYYRH